MDVMNVQNHPQKLCGTLIECEELTALYHGTNRMMHDE